MIALRLTVAALVLLLARVAAAQTTVGRMFFQSDAQGGTPGVGEFEWRPTPDVRVFDNPDLLVEPGHVERMYLYYEYHLANLKMISMGIDVRAVGDGLLAGWHIYNTNIAIQTRWNGIGNRAGSNAVREITQVAMINVTQFGGQNNATASTLDPHYNNNRQDGGSVRGTVLLGWVDVRLDGPGGVEVFFDVGPATFSRAGGDPVHWMYFGFGDDYIDGHRSGATSTLFDARLRPVPEPASLTLLFLATVVSCRWNRR